MIDFTTLQGLTIPEGVVTQITDASGRVIWAVQSESGEPIVLEVEKLAFTSYSGETAYSSNCILLDIYPKKSNSTVNVTYGGLTKTLTFSGTNAQQVFFGTFNDVTDSVTTSASGTLTIEGGCVAFGCSAYQSGSKTININYCLCVTAIYDFGAVTKIPSNAFGYVGASENPLISVCDFGNNITSIDKEAFSNCRNASFGNLPEGLITIGDGAFRRCDGITSMTIPKNVSSIGVSPWMQIPSVILDVESENKRYKMDERALVEIDTGRLVYGHTDGYIPSCVTIIGSNAFNGRDLRGDIIIPDNVVSIDENAFYNCNFTSSITVGRGVTNIAKYGLDTNSSTVALNIIMLPQIPPTFGGELNPSRLPYTTIIVPKGCGEAYKAAEGWSDYADQITEAT